MRSSAVAEERWTMCARPPILATIAMAASSAAFGREARYAAAVPRHVAAPRAVVGAARAIGGAQLGFDGRRRGGRRNAVERHVDDGGHATRGRRPRGGVESFPLPPPRLVHVHVGVDYAGQ